MGPLSLGKTREAEKWGKKGHTVATDRDPAEEEKTPSGGRRRMAGGMGGRGGSYMGGVAARWGTQVRRYELGGAVSVLCLYVVLCP